ncbi:PP2C family protein-serine/threonine phosphatase [Runella sp.]|uniref:PP2C family protein-serine/threonine phosphatase n=1 Tax=Runella sp. TaxID=1960881 RepID=UPI003D0D8563
MKIQLAPPLALHERGQRSNNEDNLFPAVGAASVDDRLFLVCDGVGGADKGEVASETVCQAISTYFLQHSIKRGTAQTVRDAIAYAEAELERYKETQPDSSGMATTLTLMHLNEDGVLAAHIGDSRIYHIRNGRLLWRTQDHSFVNELVKSGIITADEAPKHPKRNVITRALQGSTNAVAPDVHFIEDVRSGDYFFMCTDGVLETFSDAELLELLGTTKSDAQKMASIKQKCAEQSRDNFTAYLIRIQSAEQLVVELLTPEKSEPAKETKKVSKEVVAPVFTKQWVMVLVLVNFILFGTIAWLLWGKKEEVKTPAKPVKTEVGAPEKTPDTQFSETKPKNELPINKPDKKTNKKPKKIK